MTEDEKMMQADRIAELASKLPQDVQEKILCTIQGAMMVQPQVEPA